MPEPMIAASNIAVPMNSASRRRGTEAIGVRSLGFFDREFV